MACVIGLSDAVVGLVTPMLPILAWIVSAACAKITGVTLWWYLTLDLYQISLTFGWRTATAEYKINIYNINSILFYIVGHGALYSILLNV